MLRIQIPQNSSLRETLNFCNRLWRVEQSEEIVFDFIRMGRAEPFTMALLATVIKRFRESRPDTKFRSENHAENTYAAHMGFFQAFGLKHGNMPGEALGNTNYLPLTYVESETLQNAANEAYEPIGETLDRMSHRLSRILVRQDNGPVVDTLAFSLREILRNVIEHSNSQSFAYCAQFWPTRSLVELAVVDTGIGIKASLSGNPHLEIDSDRTAIQLALMPNISGKMFKGVKSRPHDHWQNSGYGLYMTSRLCRSGGSFFLASGDSGILLEQAQKTDYHCYIPGTALRLVMDTNRIQDLRQSLNQFKEQGYAIARRYTSEDALTPSKASTMLARDFSED